MTSTVDAEAEHPPIYQQMLDEQGNVPADVAATADRVLREAEQAVGGTGIGRGASTSAGSQEQ